MRALHVATGAGFLVGGVVLLAACSSSGTATGTDGGTDGHAPPADAHHDVIGDANHADHATTHDTGTSKDGGTDGGGTCSAYAAAVCNYLSACEPGTLTTEYGTLASCMTMAEAACTRNLSVPGSGFTAAFPAACGAQLTTYASACSGGPIPRPVPTMGPCTVVGSGAGGAACGFDVQCATDNCDVVGNTCGACTTSGALGAACGAGTGVTCAVGLACGKQDICATVVDVSKSCDVGVTTSCVAGATCVVSDGGTTGTCMASGVKAGTACNPDGIGAPGCWDTAGFFCASTNLCEPITYGAAASSCAPVDGGITKAGCTDGVCYGGSCLAHVTSGQTCAVGSGACVSATVCIDADGGAGGTCTPLKTNCHGDAGTPPFSFSPSNVGLGTIYTMASQALAENVSQPCGVNTESTGSPTDATCLNSPITIVTQEDGSTVNLVVVQSLTLQSNGAITVTGGVPLVIVSLSDVTFLGSSFIQANSTSNLGQTGPGGAPESDGDTMGGGTGGGAPASGTALIGGGGAGYCGLGGLGGGSTAAAGKRYGNQVIRPLIGGSAGGGGVVGGGGGGGAIEIVAAGSFTMSSGSYINAGGQGGVGEGGGGDQNGGGAGSGGSILIEAPVVTIAGTLAANGGGGGGGVLNAPDGSPNATFAAGGAAGTGGVAGGNGGAAAILNGSPGATATGNNSSGGGGGVGRIRIASSAANATLTGSVISPSPTTVCATQGDLRDITAGP